MKTQTFTTDGPYMMDWNDGKLVKMNKAPELKRGQVIIACGAYGNSSRYVVTDGKTHRCILMGEDVRMMEDLPTGYFSEAVTTYDEYIRPFSTKFGIGFYYDDRENAEMVSESEIQRLEKRVLDIARMTEEKRKRDEEERKNDIKELRKTYGGILEELTDKYDTKGAAANARKLLKHQFPGVKFSVRKEGYDTLNVYWVDGPRIKDVEPFVNMFEGKSFDGMTDCENIIHSNFTDLYGAMGYCFCQRDISPERREEMKKRLKDTFSIFDGNEGIRFDNCELLNSARRETPESIENALHTYGQHNLSEWAYHLCHNIDYTKEESGKKETTKGNETPTDGKFNIINYSDKAIAVTGDTRSVKETLKRLGGRFNPRLTCGAGWIFSKSKEAAVRAAIC